MTTPEQEANEMLKKYAKKEHKSLRKLGIIDERRERTIREREIDFADFFAIKRRTKDV